MTWTKEYPKESGFYWYRWPFLGELLVSIVRVDIPGDWSGKISIMRPGDEVPTEDEDITVEFWPVKLEPPSPK